MKRNKKSVKILELLLGNGAKVNFRNKFGETALHCAWISGRIEAVAALLEFESHINEGLCHNQGYRQAAEYLVRHIAKMKVANLYVSEKNLQLVNKAKKYIRGSQG